MQVTDTSGTLVRLSVNGAEVEVPERYTVRLAAEQAGVPVERGSLLSLNGFVVNADGGSDARFTLNGQDVRQDALVQADADVQVVRGADVVEEAEDIDGYTVGSVADDGGEASIRELVFHGEPTPARYKLGKSSGVALLTEAPDRATDAVLSSYNKATDQKVVALTFDDGPDTTYTSEILDILAENNAHATFFVVGNVFRGKEAETALVKRESDEGHQVCTHSYTHAANAYEFKMDGLSPEEQAFEIAMGKQAIAEATGKPVSTVFRAPTGTYTASIAKNVMPYVSAEIGWTRSTRDFDLPGTDSIVNTLLSVEPGDIVLMHDAGGDRSQTVEALRQALPQLREQGWQFVTIDELLAL